MENIWLTKRAELLQKYAQGLPKKLDDVYQVHGGLARKQQAFQTQQ